MPIKAFLVESMTQSNCEIWIIKGRAYEDISVGDHLLISPKNPSELRVEGIITYGVKTDILSKMMTGTLYVASEVRLDENELEYLYQIDAVLHE